MDTVVNGPGILSSKDPDVGQSIHELATRLFPICRSLTGPGVRETLRILQESIPIQIHEVPTGTPVFDWIVPREWTIRDAFIADSSGRRIVDFRLNNLHVVGYSTPIDRRMNLTELNEHLFSLPDQPDAIPYVTSYYKERWGFCLTHRQRLQLKPDVYHVRIDSELKDGSLTYGECIIPGATAKEVFLSTYVCHPSMANNELSGPVVTTFVCRWIQSQPRFYTYRIVFIPETIGSITYLSRHLDYLRKNVVAGFNVSCVGDERAFSYVSSRYANTLADRVARHVLRSMSPNFITFSYLDRGSDERQYCSPGVDLPLVTLYRKQLWYDVLKFSYDMSVPNVARLDPQHGGCCTVMPFFLGEILELPVTTIQDYTLFNILNDYSIDIWKQQIGIIMGKHGFMNFIVHPDYIMKPRERGVYEALLDHLDGLRDEKSLWITTPGEVNRWWRQRAEMRLVKNFYGWEIEGLGKERARIAFASENHGRLVFTLENSGKTDLTLPADWVEGKERG